ncbi:MAG: hypothetical protein MHMPM18_002150 [Marteilia pararefringens]
MNNVDSSSEVLECRFGYPKPISSMRSRFVLQEHGQAKELAANGGDASKKIFQHQNRSWKFVPERDDARIVAYNPTILQTWRANTDVTPVTSTHVLVEYITKYLTKSDQEKIDDVMYFDFFMINTNYIYNSKVNQSYRNMGRKRGLEQQRHQQQQQQPQQKQLKNWSQKTSSMKNRVSL